MGSTCGAREACDEDEPPLSSCEFVSAIALLVRAETHLQRRVIGERAAHGRPTFAFGIHHDQSAVDIRGDAQREETGRSPRELRVPI